MRLLQKLIFILLSVFLVSTGFSQKALKKAEKQFSLKAYDLAVSSYTRALDEDPNCTDCIFMIAESYRMMNRNLDAALWYKKLKDAASKPENFYLNYGLVMKRMGLYDKAQDLFFNHKMFDPIAGDHFALSCDYAKSALSATDKFEVSLFRNCTKSSDFAASFLGDNLVFSSFRNDLKRDQSIENKSYIQNRGSQLFISKKGREANIDNLSFLRNDLEENFEVSAASFSGDNSKCAYTKSNFVDGFRQIVSDEMDLSIYLADANVNGDIKNDKAFVHNELGYATAFPTLNHNGTIMYFASNRPGGFGGFDIYVSYYKQGAWSYPENLGSNINSPGNEVTPFFDGQKLYYSSDYHHGLGGFDIFISSINAGDWSYPENLGKGINSPEDDLYLAVDPQTKTLYYSSNRLGGRGNHDIYYAVPVFEHDYAVNDQAMDSDALVPKAVSLIDLETPMEAPDSGMAITVSEDEKINVKVIDVDLKKHKDYPQSNQTTYETPAARKQAAEKSTAIQEPVQQFDPNNPPPAVDLTKLNTNKAVSSSVVNNTKVVSKMEVSLAGAKKVAMGEVIRSSSQVYFIQLAALFNNRADMNSFNTLTSYGSIYKMYESQATKIKLGYYLDQYEANQILQKVKNAGFYDAFITHGPLNTSSMELALSSNNGGGADYTNYNTTTSSTQYKVRLAAYEDPMHFDVDRVRDIGVIEQWSKQNWTIFVLSGFNSFEEAESARIKALNRGYQEAEVVLDNNGILEKMSRN